MASVVAHVFFMHLLQQNERKNRPEKSKKNTSRQIGVAKPITFYLEHFQCNTPIAIYFARDILGRCVSFYIVEKNRNCKTANFNAAKKKQKISKDPLLLMTNLNYFTSTSVLLLEFLSCVFFCIG